MTETFVVQSKLTLTTDVNQVLRQLIEGFENIDRAVKGTQEKLVSFERTLKDLGDNKSGFKSLFSELEKLQSIKLGGSLLSDLAKASELSSSIATAHMTMKSAAMDTAAAWREIAAASKQIRNPTAPQPGGAGAGSGGAGGGGRRGGGGSGGGGSGNPLFGEGDDWPNARWGNSDFDARQRFQERMDREQEMQLNKKFAEDYYLGNRENNDRDRIARRRSKFDDDWYREDYALGKYENDDRDRVASRRTQEERQKYSDDYGLGKYENDDLDRIARRKDQEERRKFSSDYALANRENRDYDIRNKPPKGMSHFELGHAGVGLQMAGDAGTGFFEKAIMSGFDFEHKFAVLTGDMRVTDKQQDELRKELAGVTRDVKGSTLGGNLEIFNDLKNAFGDFNEAKEELKSFSKMVTVLQMADLRHGGEGNMNQALAMARFIEDQGGAIDLKDPTKYDKGRFDEIANRAVSIAIATQMRVTPREMLAFQKTGRTGGMMMNDHALYEETPYFAASLGSSRLGTAIFSDMQVMLAGRLDKAHASELQGLGLLGPGHEEGTGRNRRYVYDPASLKERDMLASDPYKWIHDVLGEAVAKKVHADPTSEEGKTAILLELTKAAQRGTIAGLWGDVYRNFGPTQKEGRNISSQNPDMLGHLLDKDPMAQLMVFKAAQNEFMVTLGELLKGPAVEYLKQFTSALHDMVDWLNKNPDAASEIAKIGAEVAIVSKIFGTLAMTVFFVLPMFKALASVLGLFAMGGRAAAGLLGLTTGATALAETLGAAKAAKAATAVTGAAAAAGTGGLLGMLGLGAYFGFKGAQMSGADIAAHGQAGETPGMIDEFGHAIYYKPGPSNAQSLVTPPATSTKGTDSDPIVVHVQNQVSGHDIATGVSTNMATKMNRPQSGVTGGDLRMNLTPAYQGLFGG